MGRRRRGRFALWRCSIPEQLALRVETAIVDPLTRKPIYGYRSQLVTALLLRYLDDLATGTAQPIELKPNSELTNADE